jgi:hypothetical protein
MRRRHDEAFRHEALGCGFIERHFLGTVRGADPECDLATVVALDRVSQERLICGGDSKADETEHWDYAIGEAIRRGSKAVRDGSEHFS